MNFEPVIYQNNQHDAENILKILHNAGLSDSYINEDSISNSFAVYVNSNDYEKASDIINSFLEDLSKNTDSEDEYKNVSIYATASDKYKDNLSSALTFLFFGVFGLIIIALLYFDTFTFIKFSTSTKIMYCSVFGIVFIAFIVGGMISFINSKKIKLQLDVNSTLTEEIMNYIDSNIEDSLNNIDNDNTLPSEVKYLRKCDIIKELISKRYPEINENLADEICDKYLSSVSSSEKF